MIVFCFCFLANFSEIQHVSSDAFYVSCCLCGSCLPWQWLYVNV